MGTYSVMNQGLKFVQLPIKKRCFELLILVSKECHHKGSHLHVLLMLLKAPYMGVDYVIVHVSSFFLGRCFIAVQL